MTIELAKFRKAPRPRASRADLLDRIGMNLSCESALRDARMPFGRGRFL